MKLPDMTKSLMFCGEISDSSVKSFIQEVKQNSEQSPDPEMTVLFSSTGGGTIAGLYLHDFLRIQARPILMVGSVAVSSAGMYPFLAGDTRVALPGTRFFIHALTLQLEQSFTLQSLREKRILMEADHDRSVEVLLDRTCIPKGDLDDMLLHGRVLTTVEACDYGIIHGVAEFTQRSENTDREQGEGGKASPATS